MPHVTVTLSSKLLFLCACHSSNFIYIFCKKSGFNLSLRIKNYHKTSERQTTKSKNEKRSWNSHYFPNFGLCAVVTQRVRVELYRVYGVSLFTISLSCPLHYEGNSAGFFKSFYDKYCGLEGDTSVRLLIFTWKTSNLRSGQFMAS